MTPTIPPLSSFRSFVSTGASLLVIGCSIKVVHVFSSFMSRTLFETGLAYLTGYYSGALLDKFAPNLPLKRKIIVINSCVILSGAFLFKISLINTISAAIVLTSQSRQQNVLPSLSSLWNRFFPANARPELDLD